MIRFLLPSVGLFSLILFAGAATYADGPADNVDTEVRPIPPEGIEVDGNRRRVLLGRCVEIRDQWRSLLASSKSKTGSPQAPSGSGGTLAELTPEILVFPRAVEMAFRFNQIYRPAEIEVAGELLDEAERRMKLAKRSTRWSDVVGITEIDQQQLVIGGYQSKIDGSFQPYAIVIPASFRPGETRPHRLDIWFHGRGEKLSELSFLDKGRKSAGQYTPRDTFVLHPYGRYSNAFKFAGEVDVLEALAHVQSNLPIDDAKISVRGFSMGGAACWQFATHNAGRFFAANPGAGFSETPEFLKSFQGEDLSATPAYQRVLWALYDCPPWSRNLVQCPTVAYSGEIDRQKQAADVMADSLSKNGIDLVHVIGPETGHKIHPDSKTEIERRMDSLAALATPSAPTEIDMTTYTLRYHRCDWVDVQGLNRHWSPARVRASLRSDEDLGGGFARVEISTKNVSELKLDFASGQWSGAFPVRPVVRIDGDVLTGPPVRSDRSWSFNMVRSEGNWTAGTSSELRKRPGLQGPIDDAFMDSFVFVLPTGTSSDDAAQQWYTAEAEHAQLHWQKHFRGDLRSVNDTELNDSQIADSNLVLFGDAESNAVIAKIVDRLPVRRDADSINIGKSSCDRDGHVVAMIYPNPLNPERYVVLNSGFTFREYDYLNNARQTPKLPDWALIDIRNGATTRAPGAVVAAGFFDESWQPEP